MPWLLLLLACGLMDAPRRGAKGEFPRPRQVDEDKAQRKGLDLVTFNRL